MTTQENRLVRLEEGHGEINKKLDRIIYSMEGNGQPGMKVRVDRLETSAADAKWAKRAGFSALIGVVAQFIYEVLNK